MAMKPSKRELPPGDTARQALREALDALLFDAELLKPKAEEGSLLLPPEIVRGLGYTTLINERPLEECSKEEILEAIIALVGADRSYYDHFVKQMQYAGISDKQFSSAYQGHFAKAPMPFISVVLNDPTGTLKRIQEQERGGR